MMQEVLRTMCSFSETMPMLPESLISRDQYLDLFDIQFRTKKILCISRNSGVGITTVMALYAQRHANECASFFNTLWSQAMLNIRVLENSIVNQLKCYVDDTNETSVLTSLIHKVNNTSRKKKGVVYFVFDGLDLLPLAYTDRIRHILVQLYGINNARFLFSGDIERIRQIVPDPDNVNQTNEILPFSKSEIMSYLSMIDNTLSKDQVDILCAMSKSIGDRLHVIMHKLKNEGGVDVLTDMYFNNIDDLYELDFEFITQNEKNELFIALLTFSEYPLSQELLRISLNLSQTEYNSLYCQLKKYVREDNGIVTLYSCVFRKYLLDKLQHVKNEVDQVLISILEKEKIEDSFDYLSTLYKANKKETLVKYLTSNRVQQFLEEQQSQAALNKQCDFGYQACSNFELQMSSFFRFAINRSVSREIEKNELTDAEIEAMISIGAFEKALALTQNIFLHEEKLKGLLIIAQYKDELPLMVYQELLEQIKSLIEIIQFEQIPDKAIELAKLMLPIDFIKALTIIDRVAKVTKDKNQLDRLYAAISMSYNTEGKQTSETAKEDLAATRIVDDDLRQMATIMKNIMRERSVEQVLQETDKLPTVTSKLYFLKYWIPNHKKSDKIEEIIKYALGLVIDESNATIPKISLIRHFSKPLPLVPETAIMELVGMIDALISTIKYPTIEYVELQLLIIIALKKVDSKMAKNRAENLYLEIDELPDKSIQAHCKALLLRDFDKIGAGDMEDWIMPSYQLQKELTDDICDLLSKSAYHVKIVEGPIKALVCDYPTVIQKIIAQINTEERRCRAYLLALTEYVTNIRVSRINWTYFDLLFNGINYDLSEIDKPLVVLATKIIEDTDIDLVNKNIKILCSKLKDAEHSLTKCKVLAMFHVWMCNNSLDDSFKKDVIEKNLHEIWNQIGTPWVKVELGYKIAQILSKESTQDLARKYVEETAILRDRILLSSISCVETYAQSMTLLQHSLGILIRLNISEDDYIDELEDLLSYNGDEGEAMIVWSRIALEYREAGNYERFSRIVHDKLSTSYKDSSRYSRKRVLYHIAPALYMCGSSMFYDRIKEFDDCFKNLCMENIARYVETHYPYTEYVDTSLIESQRVLDYGDYEVLIDLMKNTTDEHFVYNYVDRISKALKENSENRLSREQINILSSKLKKLVNNCLPMANGIQHNGYKIICNAMIDGVIPGQAINVPKVRTEIETITNVADKAFLYSNIAGYLKKKDQSESFLRLAMSETEKIGDMFDKLNRFNNCLLQAFSSNPSLSRSIARKTMESMLADNNGTYQDYQKYVDTISEHDYKLAEDMLEMVDNDPARIQYKRKLRERLVSTKRLDVAKKDFEQIEKLTKEEQIHFFEKQMEYLVKKTNFSKELSKTEIIVRIIYENPIREIQSAALFFIENLYCEYKRNRVSSETLRELYKILRQNIKLVLALAAGTKNKLDRINKIFGNEFKNKNIVPIGHKMDGQNLIISWYRENPYGILQVIDPYFIPAELRIIRSLMDINNNLQVKILTHLGDGVMLDNFQKEWKKISSELPGSISIEAVCFVEQPSKCPIHDRWWIIYDQENDLSFGKRLSSLSTMGIRETEISDMDDDAISSVKELWSKYCEYRPLRVGGKEILYQEIEIQQ